MYKSGFSLLELMVVLTIIGIVSGFSFPRYQRYLRKVKVVKAISSLNQYKLNITEHIFTTGTLPSDPKAVFNGDGVVKFSYDNELDSINYTIKDNKAVLSVKLKVRDSKNMVYLIGELGSDTVSWYCDPTKDNSVDEYPSSCLKLLRI